MEKKLRMTTVTIDEEVWKYLNNRKQLGKQRNRRDSINSVLRRILNLNDPKNPKNDS